MSSIKLFDEMQIRAVWSNKKQKWYFALSDVVIALTNTVNVKQYIKYMKKRDKQLAQNWYQFVSLMPVETPGGLQNMKCASEDELLRILQLVRSSKKQKFKIWLAKVSSQKKIK